MQALDMDADHDPLELTRQQHLPRTVVCRRCCRRRYCHPRDHCLHLGLRRSGGAPIVNSQHAHFHFRLETEEPLLFPWSLSVASVRVCPIDRVPPGLGEPGITETIITCQTGIRYSGIGYNGNRYNKDSMKQESGITESGRTESGITENRNLL